MRSNGGFVLVLVTAILSLGPVCDSSVSEEEVCEKLCSCESFYPDETAACTNDCVANLPDLSDDCLYCVMDSDCVDLESGRACRDECFTSTRTGRLIGED